MALDGPRMAQQVDVALTAPPTLGASRAYDLTPLGISPYWHSRVSTQWICQTPL